MSKAVECDSCKGCKYEMFPSASIYCKGCTRNSIDKYTSKKFTNADRIRNMSNEDLEIFICSIKTYEEGSVITIEDGFAMDSVSDVQKWLESEV